MPRAQQALLYGCTAPQELSQVPVLALIQGGEGLGRECSGSRQLQSECLRQDSGPPCKIENPLVTSLGCWDSTASRSCRQGLLCIAAWWALCPSRRGHPFSDPRVTSVVWQKRSVREHRVSEPTTRTGTRGSFLALALAMGSGFVGCSAPRGTWRCAGRGWLSVPVTDS